MRSWLTQRKPTVGLVVVAGLIAIVAAAAGPSSAGPPPVPERPGDISSAEFASCATTAVGKVECDNRQSWSPVKGLDDARSLFHGAGTMCVVHKNGRVSCELTSEGSPIYVAGISDAIEASTYYWSSGVDYGNGAAEDSGACVLLNDGTVSCWSLNNPNPTIIAIISDATSVAAGRFKSCASVSGAQFACWDTLTPSFRVRQPTTEASGRYLQAML
jgi:hypothetical protein